MDIWGRVSCWNTLRKRSRRENDGFGRPNRIMQRFFVVPWWSKIRSRTVDPQARRRLAQFLKSRTICHLDVHGIEIYKPPRLEIIPILGWSYPEAQTATSTSCDTTVQSSLQPALKKRIMWASRKVLQNNRLLNRDLSAVNLKIIFLFKKGSGWPPITSWKTVSQNLHWNLYAIWIFKKENLARLSIGNRISSKLRHAFLKDGGSGSCDDEWIDHIWKGISKTWLRSDLLYVRAFQGHTRAEVIAPELMGHVAVHFNWKEFIFHRGCACDSKSVFRADLSHHRWKGKLDPWRWKWRNAWRWLVNAQKSTPQD